LKRMKAKELYDAEQKRKEEEHRQKEYVEKWKREEAEKADKAKREKEAEDAKFEERVKLEFMAAGYSQEHIDAIIHKRREKDNKDKQIATVDLSRPTFIKVQRKYLSPTTLDLYELPWEFDDDGTYIIIKKWISHDLQEELFAHTRKLKVKKLIMGPIEKETVTTLKVKGEGKDEMFLVRKKSGRSPGRRGYMFT